MILKILYKINFRVINGKCFQTNENKLILAKHKLDNTLDGLLTEFSEYQIK